MTGRPEGEARGAQSSDGDPRWDAATWAGARRAALRRALERTPRERLEHMEALCETARRLARAGAAARERAAARGVEREE